MTTELNHIYSQIKQVQVSIEAGEYCTSVIEKIDKAKDDLEKVRSVLLKNYLLMHLNHFVHEEKDSQTIDEMMLIFKLVQKGKR